MKPPCPTLWDTPLPAVSTMDVRNCCSIAARTVLSPQCRQVQLSEFTISSSLKLKETSFHLRSPLFLLRFYLPRNGMTFHHGRFDHSLDPWLLVGVPLPCDTNSSPAACLLGVATAVTDTFLERHQDPYDTTGATGVGGLWRLLAASGWDLGDDC